MSKTSQYKTAPQDRVPFAQKLIYGLGAFVNNLLAAAIGGMIIVLNLGLGMNPALVGLLGALPRLTDALTDPLMGYISDHTKSRWGRRRPYIFIGAILAGLVFALLWQLPRGHSEAFYFWFFLIGSLVFYLGYTIFATPWVALGYELTPDYNERTRLMGVQNFIGQLAYVVAPWFLLFMQSETYFDDMVDGAAGLAIIIAVVTIGIGILPAIFLRERLKVIAELEAADKSGPREGATSALLRNMKEFFAGFAKTLKFKPFLQLSAATFLVFNGFMMISSFQFYVIIYYVFGGDTVKGAEYAGYAGTLGAVSTFAVIFIVTWLGTKIGKRRAFFVAIGLSMVGYALKWVCYNPEIPWLLLLPAPLLAFGLGGLFTLMPAMIADVVDLDELSTHERREGMFGSIFWWVVKLGMAAALAAGGFLLNATGFDVALQGDQAASTIYMMRVFDAFLPFVTSAIAIWAIASYSITGERAHEIRQELERRRGTPDQPEVAVAGLVETAGSPAVSTPVRQRHLDSKSTALLSRPDRFKGQGSRMTQRNIEQLYSRPMSLLGQDYSTVSGGELRSLFRTALERKIHGIAFSPYLDGQGPGTQIGEAQIRDRLAVISPYVHWIRSFSCTDGNQAVPRIAKEAGLKTLVGAWLEDDRDKNDEEIRNVIEVAKAGHADIVAVGNEVLLRGDLTEDELIGYIDQVKKAVPTARVGYVDAYFEFVDHPRVTAACDVILANCYPFWEGCAAEYSLLYMKEMYRRAVGAANGKPVIISETGWPNIGTATGAAIPSQANAIQYFLNAARWAEEDGIEMFYFSSFDESWKVDAEGDVGAYWGLWDKDGHLKYD